MLAFVALAIAVASLLVAIVQTALARRQTALATAQTALTEEQHRLALAEFERRPDFEIELALGDPRTVTSVIGGGINVQLKTTPIEVPVGGETDVLLLVTVSNTGRRAAEWVHIFVHVPLWVIDPGWQPDPLGEDHVHQRASRYELSRRSQMPFPSATRSRSWITLRVGDDAGPSLPVEVTVHADELPADVESRTARREWPIELAANPGP